MFADLVADISYLPQEDVDRIREVESVLGMERRDKYVERLKRRAARYVSNINQMCSRSPHLRIQLDKT